MRNKLIGRNMLSLKENKSKRTWDRLFDLKVGDTVRVVNLYTTMDELHKYLGKRGIIISVLEDYFSPPSLDIPRGNKPNLSPHGYKVKFTKGEKIYFRREELMRDTLRGKKNGDRGRT